MAKSSDDELARRLAALRQSYVAEGPGRLAELWSSFARVQNGDVAALTILSDKLHKLAGTGGAYGLAEVTVHARAAEGLCRTFISAGGAPGAAECEALRTEIQNLATAFAEAAIEE